VKKDFIWIGLFDFQILPHHWGGTARAHETSESLVSLPELLSAGVSGGEGGSPLSV
jgi:hypothetical protein